MQCLSLQDYEPGMEYDAHECLLQLLASLILLIMMTACLRSIN